MPLYLSASATFKVGTDSTLAQLLANRSVTETEGTDHEELVSHYIEIADAASGLAISLGPLTTCKALFVISDRQITVNINGSEAITLGHTAAEEAWLLLPQTSFTSLTVDNSSGAVANAHIVMVGV